MKRAFNSSVMTVFNEKSEFLSSSFDSEDDTPKTNVRQMEKSVGLVGGISLIAAVANYSGSVGMTLLVWVGCGVLSMMASLCYVELGVSVPKSGAEYAYLLEAFGEIPAFLFTFVSAIILRPASVAAILLTAGNYVVEPFFRSDCESSNKILTAKLLAAAFLGETNERRTSFLPHTGAFERKVLENFIILQKSVLGEVFFDINS